MPEPEVVPPTGKSAAPVQLARGFYREGSEGYAGGTIPATKHVGAHISKQIGEQTTFKVKSMDYAEGSVSEEEFIRTTGRAATVGTKEAQAILNSDTSTTLEAKEAIIRERLEAQGGADMQLASQEVDEVPPESAQVQASVEPMPSLELSVQGMATRPPAFHHQAAVPTEQLMSGEVPPANYIRLRLAGGKNIPVFSIRALEVIIAQSNCVPDMNSVVIVTDPDVVDIEFPIGEYELTVTEENGVMGAELGYAPVPCNYAGQSFIWDGLRFSIFGSFQKG